MFPRAQRRQALRSSWLSWSVWLKATVLKKAVQRFLLIGYGVGHKDTANTLQSHEWALTNNGQTQTAKFDKSNHLSVGQGDMKYSYSYKISKKNDQEYLTISGKGSMSEPIKYVYKIADKDKGFDLTLDKDKSNRNALNDTDDFVGDIQLAEK
uniref:hypothetical protein n=1 Tax=Levilactobacillus zymae TaxID=267363 RepID=UPI001749C7D7|nr:hypothetical protein [Levilactobacillus zymae]